MSRSCLRAIALAVAGVVALGLSGCEWLLAGSTYSVTYAPMQPPFRVGELGYAVEIERRVTNDRNPRDYSISFQYYIFDTWEGAASFFRQQGPYSKTASAPDVKFIYTSSVRLLPYDIVSEISQNPQKYVPSAVEQSLDQMMSTSRPSSTPPPPQ